MRPGSADSRDAKGHLPDRGHHLPAMWALNRSLSSRRGILLDDERRWVSRQALLFASLACEFGAPNFFLAFLVADELLEGRDADEPEVAGDKLTACEARDVMLSLGIFEDFQSRDDDREPGRRGVPRHARARIRCQ